MLIPLLQSIAGPNGNHAPGAILEVSEKEAVALVGHRIAEYAEPETTLMEPNAERAVQPKPRKRRLPQ